MKKAILFVFVFSAISFAESETVWRIFSFQANPDGKFTVICVNGATEVVSQADLLGGQACGDPPPVFVEEGMTAGIRANLNYFQVKCSDGSTERVNLRAFRDAAPCFRVGRQLLGGDTYKGRSQNISQDTLHLQPFELKTATKVNGVGLKTSKSADPQMVVGIYSTDKEGYPSHLVLQSEEMDVAGTQLYITAVRETKLKPGKYFVAAHSNDTVSLGAPSAKKHSVNGFYTRVRYTGKLPSVLPGKALAKFNARPYAFFAIARASE